VSISNKKKVPSICPYCGVGCGIYLVVSENKIIKIEGDKSHPINGGKLCPKGYYGYEFIYDSARLTYPLIKKGNEFVPVSWTEALTYIAEKLKEIKQKFGPDAIALYSSSKIANEDNYLVQKFARAVIGTNNVDNCARLCHAPSTVGLMMTVGAGASTNSFLELSKYSDVIFIIGSNLTKCHPIIGYHVIKAKTRGAKLIVADPRLTEIAKKADIWLKVPPGYNIPLINSIIHVIIKENLIKKDFVNKYTTGFEDLAKIVEKYTPEYVESLTGIQRESIIKAAYIYGKAEAGAILYSMGITHFTHGTAAVIALVNLALITGNIGRAGTGIFPLRGHNNVQGNCDMGCLPNVLPGYLSINVKENRERFEKKWRVKLPATPGLKITEVLSAILKGQIKAWYIIGANPVMSFPNCDQVRDTLNKLDLLIVQDIFLTETARLADVVLPAACWAERDGTFTNTERRVQLIRKAIDPPGEAKPDWWILAKLAQKMGYKGMNYTHPQEIWDEVRNLLPEKFGGITYTRLEKEKGIIWPCPTEDHPGTPIFYQNGKFLTSSGKAKIYPVEFDVNLSLQETGIKKQNGKEIIIGSISEFPTKEYPFILTTGRRTYHFHTGTLTRKTHAFNRIWPWELVEINPEDAEKLGIEDRDFVKVFNKRGYMIARAWVTDRIPPGVIFTSFHYWESCCNELTNDLCDPLSGTPEYKITTVNIEKISAKEVKKFLEIKKEKYKTELEKITITKLISMIKKKRK